MGRIVTIEPREPVHGLALEEIALRVLAHRRRLRSAELRHRVDQELECDPRTFRLRELADDRREIAAGRVSADSQPRRDRCRNCRHVPIPISSRPDSPRPLPGKGAPARGDSRPPRRGNRSDCRATGKDRHASQDRRSRNRRRGRKRAPAAQRPSHRVACRRAARSSPWALASQGPLPARPAFPCRGKCSTSSRHAPPAARSRGVSASRAAPSGRAAP